MSATVRAVGGDRQVPAPDPFARDYLLLALRLDARIPGLVDGFFGPAELKATVDTEQLCPPARLVDDAADVLARLDAEVSDPARREWLRVQVVALETHARALAGEALPYLDHVVRCFDVEPRRRPEAEFEAAAAKIDHHLPGPGDLPDRLAAWDDRLVVSPDRLPPILDWLVARFRTRAGATFGLPEGEDLRVSLVTGQPWSGYNWYDGGLRSRVDLNTDLPIRAPDLLGVMSHETYPGHHLEHAWKEAGLVTRQSRLEASVLLINAPECLISEGLAEVGRRFAIPASDEVDLLVELFARAALPLAADPVEARAVAEVAAAIRAPRAALRAVDVNAALLRHVDGVAHDDVRAYLKRLALLTPQRAEKKLEFIEHPLWRTYTFVYTEGTALLERWLAGIAADAQAARFRRLLVEQVTPSGIAAEIAADDAARDTEPSAAPAG